MCKTFLKTLAACALIASTASLTSCDGVIYEDLEPCEVTHSLRFRWDHNMLFADAFQGNVKSVAVYGFDAQTDKLAWVRTEKGDALAMDGYTMKLNDVPAGDYTVVTWAGLENDGERPESFIPADMVVGESTRQDLTCRMEREIRGDGTHHSSVDLYDLWHGTAYGVKIYDATDAKADGSHQYLVNLKKDTNRVRIILQQLSGEDVNVDKFAFAIRESNGYLGHDNEPLPDSEITYHPHHTSTGSAEVETEEQTSGSRAQTQVKVAVADLTMSRLLADRKTYLTIHNDKNEQVVRIPLTDYALLVKGNYSVSMTDQEYLDREDSYTLTFFLDKNGDWMSAKILINSWSVVINPADFNK